MFHCVRSTDNDISAENLADPGDDAGHIDYIDEKNDRRAVVSKYSSGSGGIALSKSERWGIEMSNETQYPISEIIPVNRADDKTLALSGEQYSLSAAVSFAEEWVTGFWSKYEPEYTYNVKSVILRPAPEVFDNSGESVTAELVIEKRLNGVPLDELGQLSGSGEQLFASRIIVKMAKPDEIFYFSNNGSLCASFDTENAQEIKSLLTLKSAVQTASDRLSGAMCVKITDISLKYALSKDRLFPVWAFEAETSYRPSERRSVYVNAATGEVTDDMQLRPVQS